MIVDQETWLLGDPQGEVHSVNMPNKWMIHIQNRTGWNGVSLYHATQKFEQFKTYELYTDGIFHLVFQYTADHSYLKLWKAKPQIQGVLLCVSML